MLTSFVCIIVVKTSNVQRDYRRVPFSTVSLFKLQYFSYNQIHYNCFTQNLSGLGVIMTRFFFIVLLLKFQKFFPPQKCTLSQIRRFSLSLKVLFFLCFSNVLAPGGYIIACPGGKEGNRYKRNDRRSRIKLAVILKFSLYLVSDTNDSFSRLILSDYCIFVFTPSCE